MKIRIILLALVCIVCPGCLASKLAKEIAKSDATVKIEINTIYGRASLMRANPRDGQTVTLTPDGNMRVESKCE